MPGSAISAVSSITEARQKYGDNFGQMRPNEISNGRYVNSGKSRLHDSTDIKLPPGSPVHLVASGTVTTIGQAMAVKGYGYFLEQDGDDGRHYNYVHLQERPSLQQGRKYPAGTFIGITLKDSMPGGSASHLHLQVKDKSGKAINPYEALGTEGFNRMIGAIGSKEDSSPGSSKSVAISNTSAANGGTSYGDFAPLFGSGKSVQTHRFEIVIREGHKPSITRSANRSPVAPGQMVTTVSGDL
jgi:murein DD-endopeptidase MepM/ murein hydrolase activator NlpD